MNAWKWAGRTSSMWVASKRNDASTMQTKARYAVMTFRQKEQACKIVGYAKKDMMTDVIGFWFEIAKNWCGATLGEEEQLVFVSPAMYWAS